MDRVPWGTMMLLIDETQLENGVLKKRKKD